MKPNVLFILTDDQRFDTIGALNNDAIKTPNLDRLAKMGTAFTNAHIPGGTSAAVCMPSRAMINSGKTLFHLYEEGDEIPKSDITIGECFKKNGYHTIGIGKWHNGTESYARSFCDGDNIFFGGMWDHWNVPVCSYHPDGIYNSTINITPNFFRANRPMNIICEKMSLGTHSTELMTDTAIEFLKQKQKDPFYMYLAYLAPHDPRSMPKEYQDMYKPEDIVLPPNFMQSFYVNYGVDINMRDESLAAYPRNEEDVKQHICDYYAMISHVDYNIGRLLDTLEQTGELDNTIIVFAGDNGLALGQHGMMGKQSIYDHSVRIPLIMCGGGIQQGQTNDSLVYLLDIYPTLCELLGMDIPSSVEGKSFKPALVGENFSGREDLYLAYTGLVRGVKTKKHKLIEYKLQKDNPQLFDIENDPYELENLYNKAEYSNVLADLKNRMQFYRQTWENNSKNPHTNDFWGTELSESK